MISKRQIAFTVAYVCVFTTLAAIGYFVGDYSFRAKTQKMTAHNSSVVESSDTAFYDMPRMNLTITSSEGDNSTLRIDMSLEVPKSELTRLDSYQPRITDHLVQYLRHQNIDELRQASREHEFKAQLLEETNKASYPVPIMDIIFRRFIIL